MNFKLQIEYFRRMRRRTRWIALLLIALFVSLIGATRLDNDRRAPIVRLPGHVLPVLVRAVRLTSSDQGEGTSRQPLILTVVLKRDDQRGFERYLHSLYEQDSKNFRHF